MQQAKPNGNVTETLNVASGCSSTDCQTTSNSREHEQQMQTESETNTVFTAPSLPVSSTDAQTCQPPSSLQVGELVTDDEDQHQVGQQQRRSSSLGVKIFEISYNS